MRGGYPDEFYSYPSNACPWSFHETHFHVILWQSWCLWNRQSAPQDLQWYSLWDAGDRTRALNTYNHLSWNFSIILSILEHFWQSFSSKFELGQSASISNKFRSILDCAALLFHLNKQLLWRMCQAAAEIMSWWPRLCCRRCLRTHCLKASASYFL